MIHPTAIVDKSAAVSEKAKVGPYCVVGPNVTLEDGVELISHVCIDGHTRVGAETVVYPFSAIGLRPQDLKFHGENSEVIIGKRNSIREYVTIQPGTENGIMKTVVGDDCLLMANTHVAHDCILGNHIIMANCATLAGHVTVGDYAVLGGLSAVHQWVRIGNVAMVGGMCGVERDVIPYGMVQGNRAELVGLNLTGLKRQKASFEEISCLNSMYHAVFMEDGIFAQKIGAISAQNLKFESEKIMLDFLKGESKRSFCMARL